MPSAQAWRVCVGMDTDTKVFAVAVEARAFSTQTWRRKPQVGHQDIVRLMAPSGGERAVPALKTIR